LMLVKNEISQVEYFLAKDEAIHSLG